MQIFYTQVKGGTFKSGSSSTIMHSYTLIGHRVYKAWDAGPRRKVKNNRLHGCHSLAPVEMTPEGEKERRNTPISSWAPLLESP